MDFSTSGHKIFFPYLSTYQVQVKASIVVVIFKVPNEICLIVFQVPIMNRSAYCPYMEKSMSYIIQGGLWNGGNTQS